AERRRDPQAPVRQRLPLYRLYGHRRFRPRGRPTARGGAVLSRPFRYVGRSLERVEDPQLLRGRSRFLDDVRLPGMLHVAFVRSPFGHAGILHVDTTAARVVPGVTLVVGGADIEDAPQLVTGSSRPEAGEWHRPLLARDRVRYVGEPVAAVVASSRYAAEDACELVDVEYEPLDAVVDAEQALAPEALLVHEQHGSNDFAHIELESGDVDAAFASADRVFRNRFHFGRTHAAPLETRGGIADWSDDLVVWNSTQMPFLVRS